MEIIRLNDENLPKAVQRAVSILKRGGIVLYPTDTLYGLAVDALNRPAIARLRELKGREAKKPMSIVVEDVNSIKEHATLHEAARVMAEQNLPGALTVVLPGKKHLPPELMLNGAIGVRVPNDKFALELCRKLGHPYTATSANRSGQPTLATVHEIIGQFGPLSEDIDLVIDDGERRNERPSTVVTFINGSPYVLREGAISKETLRIS